MSFGSLSQFYNGLLKEDQRKIAQNLSIHSTLLPSWLHSFSYLRNLCAHHSRIWNRELSIRIVQPKAEKWKQINNNRIASLLLAIEVFLSNLPSSNNLSKEWQKEINQLLENPPRILDFYKKMGFPFENDSFIKI